MKPKNPRWQYLVALAGVLVIAFSAADAQGRTAYFTHETINGLTKQCHYDYLGEVYSITISVTKLCPLTIQV
jgi:hypothetical protein